MVSVNFLSDSKKVDVIFSLFNLRLIKNLFAYSTLNLIRAADRSSKHLRFLISSCVYVWWAGEAVAEVLPKYIRKQRPLIHFSLLMGYPKDWLEDLLAVRWGLDILQSLGLINLLPIRFLIGRALIWQRALSLGARLGWMLLPLIPSRRLRHNSLLQVLLRDQIGVVSMNHIWSPRANTDTIFVFTCHNIKLYLIILFL